ncbi:MAG: fructose-6-phosphate aldolase [Thermoplasmata archaeon]|jgi:transaldolase|nr:fructose-6-phosphate aldolase [Thermoplasmatales archaeon]PMP75562.1 MAG: fructose-6-phosphate aldolase [Aciduliprofundum sp.]HEU12812.1 fructose-6-phosphate aldolase [Euryarchaeota archaeon]
MKIFLDTANIDEIRKAKGLGVLDGVTTNPTLISKEAHRGTFKEIVREILDEVPGPVSLEVTSLRYEEMVRQAEELSSLGKNVVIKVPLTSDGLRVIKTLNEKGIRTNATLVFSSNQGLLAAKAGATYVSPFVGRLDDIGEYGMRVVEDLKTIFTNYGFKTEIIVASVRHPIHVYEASLIGAHIVTMPYQVLERMLQHPKTDEGIQRFMEDWKKVRQ